MKEYTTVDKSTWGDGPWQREPDKVQWIDEATDLDCLIVRNRLGAWCGYVGVPEGHPLHGVEYSSYGNGSPEPSPESRFKVHGGLTFSDACHDPTEDEWLQVEARAEDPELLAEAERYPSGDAAQRLEELRRQAGMTLADWTEYQQARRICHVRESGRPEVWWFGFDCAHAGDLAPGMAATMRSLGSPRVALDDYETYRDRAYVEGEVRSLAAQLAAAR